MSSTDEIFDYIVTGAGSAGAAVAARLSESGRYRVLLLEAGPPDTNPWIHIPLGFAKTYVDPRVNWKFESAPHPQLNNRQIYVPRGKTLGGTSSINGMVYMRGHPNDYDGWRQRGCVGWDWDNVLPYFRKAQNQARGACAYHGVGGPLNVSDSPERSELAEALIGSAVALGIPRTDDFNGPSQDGAGYYQTTTGQSRRWSSAKAYLQPAQGRSNLLVRSNAHATRILFDGLRAVGVEYQWEMGRRRARAHREVIVSGGAYGSPQLLQLSGLGPATHLQEMGVEVVRDMPAVGSNLHDHFGIYLMWRCAKPITLNDLENSWPRKIAAALRYGLRRDGTTPRVSMRRFTPLKRPSASIALRGSTPAWRAAAMTASAFARVCSRGPIRASSGPTCRSTCSSGAPRSVPRIASSRTSSQALPSVPCIWRPMAAAPCVWHVAILWQRPGSHSAS